MSIVILEEGSVPLPEDLAQAIGLHKGTAAEWRRTDDGALELRPSTTRKEAIDRLGTLLDPYLTERGGGVEAFLEWREEDARLDGSL